IEEAPELADHGLELANVRLGQGALEGGGRHLLNRERGHEEPVSAERLTVHGEYLPALVLDHAMECGDLSRWRRCQQFRSRQPSRHPSRLPPLARSLRRPRLPRFLLRRREHLYYGSPSQKKGGRLCRACCRPPAFCRLVSALLVPPRGAGPW